jgi:hypothetical protein
VDAALASRRALFASQLARKHPVAFFQFVDICARSGRVDIRNTANLFHLAGAGCARVGTKGLADLLSSAAATAALGQRCVACSSWLCSTQRSRQQQ